MKSVVLLASRVVLILLAFSAVSVVEETTLLTCSAAGLDICTNVNAQALLVQRRDSLVFFQTLAQAVGVEIGVSKANDVLKSLLPAFKVACETIERICIAYIERQANVQKGQTQRQKPSAKKARKKSGRT